MDGTHWNQQGIVIRLSDKLDKKQSLFQKNTGSSLWKMPFLEKEKRRPSRRIAFSLISIVDALRDG
ncbi:hypothetical protein [Paenibacillus sp. KR2-11]|uniref:hypothetical protein n=1 Tax=Paenibacillus sp. KR2-11 TaxID=3385500 RepID=UPI0038FD1841|nr:hypothetical protein [Paenibacillus caseinilyticus]